MHSLARTRLSPLFIPQRKQHVDLESSPSLGSTGTLSPDLQPNSPPIYPLPTQNDNFHVWKIGKYLLSSPVEESKDVLVYKAVNVDTHRENVCKVLPIDQYKQKIAAYWRVGSHSHINEVEEIILGSSKAYIFFARHYGDLHSFVRTKKRLRESQAVSLFEQIVSAVVHCHENGVVLRDLKLRKFVFKNPEMTELKLECLEDACVLEDEDNDSLVDKHGCPAYVSPEILHTTRSYSGKAADSWSLGVMLYTMLAGRYPFYDTDASVLFNKIRRGSFSLPDHLSSRAKCLVRCLLRRVPDERMAAVEIPQHPWFSYNKNRSCLQLGRNERREFDQTVPSMEPLPAGEEKS